MEYNTIKDNEKELQAFVLNMHKHANKEATLFRGALNDDYVVEFTDGYKTSDDLTTDTDYKAAIVYYTYRNSWQNDLHLRLFTSLENAVLWYKSHFADRVVSEGRYICYEWAENDGIITAEEKQMEYDKMVEKLFSEDEAFAEWENTIDACLAG